MKNRDLIIIYGIIALATIAGVSIGICDYVLKFKALDKWDGKLPTTMVNSAIPFIGVGNSGSSQQ